MEQQEFDYLVIGGGSAGCVLAGRLSEDKGSSVCLLEAGGGGTDASITIPAALITTVPTRLNNWAFETVPQPGLGGRRGYQPRGRCLGGSSAINAMIYTRGHRWDYDHWAELGNAGWSHEDVLPYFLRSEGNERLGAPWHGQQGPLAVSDLRSDNPFQQRFLSAARQMGLPLNDDFNGAEQEGVGLYQVTQKGGERCSAARAYLLDHIGQRPNLQVRTRTLVRRVLFEGRRAVGVELRQGGVTQVLRARREVLLCAGALQSPQLLLLSGVGPQEELQQHGIATLHHLPGVGRNLQDHVDVVFGYSARGPDALGFTPAGLWHLWKQWGRWQRERRGLFSSNYAECGAFLKTSTELPRPNIQWHFVVGLVDDHARKMRLDHGLSLHVCLLRPRSRGSVQLQSAQAEQAPLIDPAFLAEAEDLEELVAGFKLSRRFMQTPAMAEWVRRDLFTSQVHSDEDIRAAIRRRSDTIYHPVGTCKMGPASDPLAVVDAQLRVHGLQGLRVVDASIMPTLVGGNTNAPTIMIAEKALDLIRGQAP